MWGIGNINVVYGRLNSIKRGWEVFYCYDNYKYNEYF